MAAPALLGGVRARHLRARLRVLRALEGSVRGSAIARVGWVWAVLFGSVALAVVAGAWRGVDAVALDVAQSVRAPALDLSASLVGLLGQAEVTAGIALGIAVARSRVHPRDAIVPLFIAAVVLAETALKILVPQLPPPQERSRTIELLPFLHLPFANSFPSGHVARAAFLLRIARPVPVWAQVAAVLLMTATRLYLGEHWLSDCVGGAILGIGVANVARRLS